MLPRMIATAAVAVALGVLLISKSPRITPGVYKLGFFLGLAALVVRFFPGLGAHRMESMFMPLGHAPWAYLAAGLLSLLAVSPFVVLFETGVAGYRGFSSLTRYVCLALAILGVAGLVASFLVPRLLRR